MPEASIDTRAIQKAIARAIDETSRDAAQAADYAAVMFVQSARALSKPPKGKRSQVKRGEKKRKVEKNPDYKQNRQPKVGRPMLAHTKKYRIVKLTQGGGTRYFYTDVKNDPRRVIKHAGLAWSSWAWMLPTLNGKAAKAPMGGLARKYTSVTKQPSKVAPSVTLHNRLPYLTTDNPSLVNTAMGKAAKKMQKQLDLIAERKAKRFNRG